VENVAGDALRVDAYQGGRAAHVPHHDGDGFILSAAKSEAVVFPTPPLPEVMTMTRALMTRGLLQLPPGRVES
jgi:hypothetical protein